MSDYSEQGAVPIEDAATDDPPTVDEVIERQRKEHPDQARSAMNNPPLSAEEQAAIDAGGDPVAGSEHGVEVEGPNSK
jgi:hypothetical protein